MDSQCQYLVKCAGDQRCRCATILILALGIPSGQCLLLPLLQYSAEFERTQCVILIIGNSYHASITIQLEIRSPLLKSRRVMLFGVS